MADHDQDDRVLKGPPDLSVTVGPRTFHLRTEVALYGADLSKALLDAWEEVVEEKNPNTAYCYWNYFRAFLRWVAVHGEMYPQSTVAHFYRSLRDNLGVGLTETVTGEVLRSYGAYVLAPRDGAPFTKPESRNKAFESTRSAFHWLAEVSFLPQTFASARIETFSRGNSTPCIAALSRNVDDLAATASSSHEDAAREFVETNRQGLNRLRDLLVQELREEAAAFKKGQLFLCDGSLPDPKVVERAATALVRSHWKDADARGTLCIDDTERHLAVLVNYIASAHCGVVNFNSLPHSVAKLIRYIGVKEVIRHLEGTSRALNAAFHIVLIDSGWNLQPCWDLPEQPFVSQASRGRRRIATIAARKLRAGGSVSSAPLPDMEADLPLRDSEHGLSSIEVIELWQQMSAPYRARARKTGDSRVAEMLWILPGGPSKTNAGRIIVPQATLATNWWPEFRQRHKNDPVVDTLKITRRVIRQTKFVINAADNEFDFAIMSALNNNSSTGGVAFRYLSPAGIQRMLASQIRKFQDLLEAVIVQGISSVGERLGIDFETLHQRAETGNATGLDLFDLTRGTAAVGSSGRAESQSCDPSIESDKRKDNTNLRLVPTDRAIEHLHLVRTAFRDKQSTLGAKNPERWIRMWLECHALVEAYCDRLQKSRHLVRFEKIGSQVSDKLAGGQLVLPYIW